MGTHNDMHARPFRDFILLYYIGKIIPFFSCSYWDAFSFLWGNSFSYKQERETHT